MCSGERRLLSYNAEFLKSRSIAHPSRHHRTCAWMSPAIVPTQSAQERPYRALHVVDASVPKEGNFHSSNTHDLHERSSGERCSLHPLTTFSLPMSHKISYILRENFDHGRQYAAAFRSAVSKYCATTALTNRRTRPLPRAPNR